MDNGDIMGNKMYCAFISSVYESLKDERSEVIDCLLDFRVFPICMEHFTVSVDRNFGDIKRFIDESDIFILLLGKKYGSTDENGVSWTEREFDYAVERRKNIVAIICDELGKEMNYTEEQLEKRVSEGSADSDLPKQVRFARKIGFTRTVSDKLSISTIITQYLRQVDYSTCVGWLRADFFEKKTESGNELWKKQNGRFDIGGKWYHLHASTEDKYLRIGHVTITQKFDKDNFRNVTIRGNNYNARYNREKDALSCDLTRFTRWSGEYKMDDNGVMTGIYTSCREFNDVFQGEKVAIGQKRGIHDFRLQFDDEDSTSHIRGEFHDEAPSKKHGYIILFRTQQERDDFVKEEYTDILSNKE